MRSQLRRMIRPLFVVSSLALALVAACRRPAPPPVSGTVLITGSNRGIGLEFARQYAQKGWTVLATARHPETAEALQSLAADYPDVTIERLDVTDQPGIAALAEKYRGQSIDVLINNAGILGDPASQTLDSLDYETFTQIMAVNVFGALGVSRAFLEHVAASSQKKIVSISSVMGSSGANSGGGFYFYRASKAALNRVMRTLQNDVRDRDVIVVVLAPPGVDTRMWEQGGFKGSTVSPQAAVARFIEVIAGVSPEDGGSFLFDGRTFPW